MKLVDCLLLDYVSEWRMPVAGIFSPSVGLLLNKPHHEIPTELDLSKRLVRLIDEGLLMLSCPEKKYHREIHHQEIHLNEIELQSYVQSQKHRAKLEPFTKPIHLQLTQKGGEIWEKKFKPNWEKYHSVFMDENLFIIQAGSKDFLFEILKSHQKQNLISEKGVERLYIQKLQPWRVNYWKILLLGYQTYFNANTLEEETHFFTENELLTWRYQWGAQLKDGLMEPNQWLVWWQKQEAWLERETWWVKPCNEPKVR
jgi:hypothetical protein